MILSFHTGNHHITGSNRCNGRDSQVIIRRIKKKKKKHVIIITFFGNALRLRTLYALVFCPAVARREHGQPGIRIALQVDHFVFARHFASELDCGQTYKYFVRDCLEHARRNARVDQVTSVTTKICYREN